MGDQLHGSPELTYEVLGYVADSLQGEVPRQIWPVEDYQSLCTNLQWARQAEKDIGKGPVQLSMA